MHDGLYKTLTEVVWHYNSGGHAGGPVSGEIDLALAPLLLSDGEVGDLVQFLISLTGEPLPAELALPPMLPAATEF